MEKELLTMCCVCKRIKIEDKGNFYWLAREKDSVLYDNFVNRFGEKISDGYCPNDLEKVREEIMNRRITLLSR